MKKIYFIMAVAAMFAAVSCNKDGAISSIDSVEPIIVHVRVSADKESVPYDEEGGDTKITMNDYTSKTRTYSWEADDKLQVLLGCWQDDTKAAVWHKEIVLDQSAVSEGVFEGDIDLSNADSSENPFTLSDIRGFVVVKEQNADWRMVRCAISGTIHMGISSPGTKIQDQTQGQAGVFVGEPRFGFFSGRTSSVKVTENGDIVTITGVQLGIANGIWEYRIYADADASGPVDYSAETIKSVTTTVSGTSSSAMVDVFWLDETSNSKQYGYATGSGSYRQTSSVTLATPAAIPSTKAGGALVWHGVAPSNKNITQIVVETDKAKYLKNLVSSPVNVKAGRAKIYPINLNLAGFERFAAATEYSTDGGTTWSTDFPTGTGITTLAVRGSITADDLAALNTLIKTQDATVALDMSACCYESNVFPAVFGNETTVDANPKLKSVRLPSNITELGLNAFYRCTELADIDLSNIVKLGERSLSVCPKIEEAILPVCKTIGPYAFSLGAGTATELRTVYIPEVTTIGNYAFRNQGSLTAVDCPKVTSVGDYAFSFANTKAKDNGLPHGPTSVNLPECTSLGKHAFYYCSDLASINIPKVTNVGTSTSENQYVFNQCNELTSLDLPSVTAMSRYAISDCAKLKKVTIGSAENAGNTIKIGTYPFNKCAALTEIYCYATTPPTFDGNTKNIALTLTAGGKIYVPSGALETYSTATGWTDATTKWTLTGM